MKLDEQTKQDMVDGFKTFSTVHPMPPLGLRDGAAEAFAEILFLAWTHGFAWGATHREARTPTTTEHNANRQ